MNKRSLFIISTLTALLFVACAKVVFTGRRQAKLIPSNQINALSFEQYDAFLKENPPMKSGAQLNQVRRVGLKITSSSNDSIYSP